MKVIIKFDNQTEIVENVGVDENCFPLVGGVHPFPEASRQSSQLANQSSLWFKTLAIDCVFVDCDRNDVHWFPVVNDVSAQLDVILRKPKPDHSDRSYMLQVAKPLFDPALYQMNPSIEAMMLMCKEAMQQLEKERLSRTDFHRAVASTLHKFILPFIQFSPKDAYCLSRARCMILERFRSAENNIKQVEESVHRYQECLNTLRSNLLFREKMDSEEYLSNCSPKFLHAFKKNLMEELERLKLKLEAEQGKVNWAKLHDQDDRKLSELRAERDRVEAEVNHLIMVRESISNVLTRRDTNSVRKAKRRKQRRKSSVVVASYSHDLFVEVSRQLEVDNLTLSKLCQDKVNISAAREAVVHAISKLENNNNSKSLDGQSPAERLTVLEPEDFVDYSIDQDCSSADKRLDLWPTFQERVTAILEKESSPPQQVHVKGCKNLTSLIDLALSEFKLAMDMDSDTNGDGVENGVDAKDLNAESTVEVEMRSSSGSRNRSRNHRSTVCTGDEEKGLSIHGPILQQISDLSLESTLDEHANLTHHSQYIPSTSRVIESGFVESSYPQESCISQPTAASEDLRQTHQDLVQRDMREKLALGALDSATMDIKRAIKAHFSEMVCSLEHEMLNVGNCFPLDLSCQKELLRELLWKAYERIFFKSELPKLMTLYEALLSPGLHRAHARLTTTPLQDVMGEDELLHLFYYDAEHDDAFDPAGYNIDDARREKYSMARSLSDAIIDVRHCDVEDLYKLANEDSMDLKHRFQLECSFEESDTPLSSSSSSALSTSSQGSPITGTTEDNSQRFSPIVIAESEIHEGDQRRRDKHCVLPSTLALPRAPIISSSSSDRQISVISTNGTSQSKLDIVLATFCTSLHKCVEATSFLDKLRYITRCIEGLHREIWQVAGENKTMASSDDIVSMLVLALCHLSREDFVNLYMNVRLLTDISPSFLEPTLWNCSLVNMYSSYYYLFSCGVCETGLGGYSSSLRRKF